MIFSKHKTLQDVPLADYVVFCIRSLIIFTVIIILLSCFSIAIPESLITCFFAAFGGEFLVCGLIKIFKIRESDAEDIIPDGSIAAIGFDTSPPEEDDDAEIDDTIIGFKASTN